MHDDADHAWESFCKNTVYKQVDAVFSTDFAVVSQNIVVAGGCMASARRARATRGGRGHAPPENF